MQPMTQDNRPPQSSAKGGKSPGETEMDAAEYAALETTLTSSEVGRRFLADYARQHPTPELQMLIDTVERLDMSPIEQKRKSPCHGLVSELVAMNEAISEMRREVGELDLASSSDGRAQLTSRSFDQIAEVSAHATSDVLFALEQLQNVSWTLRESGRSPEHCDSLDESASKIFTACARQEIACRQAATALRLLGDMEQRIDALIDDWSDHETQNLLDAAKSLDLSHAFEDAAIGDETDAESGDPALVGAETMELSARPNRLLPEADFRKGDFQDGDLQDGPVQDGDCTASPASEEEAVGPELAEEDVAPTEEDVSPTEEDLESAEQAELLPTVSDELTDETATDDSAPATGSARSDFESPEPLSLEALAATQRQSLFG